MTNIYDFIVIGAGISACTFASLLNKRSPDLSILLVEHGRRIGGRATTRKSRKKQEQVQEQIKKKATETIMHHHHHYIILIIVRVPVAFLMRVLVISARSES